MFFVKTGVWGGICLASGLAAGLATGAQAGQVVLDIEIPQQNVAEYHRPYVAAWVENSTGAHAVNLLVWYDVKKRENAGQRWLKDLRSWWRKSGRDLTLPIDGLTSATRAPGRQTVTLDNAVLKDLKPGTYSFVVEASREAGGHEVVKVPVNYKPGGAASANQKGEGELGLVKVDIKP